nr:hypothetical protein Rv2063c - Mycobacterium tuberculosis (strain H37RV) [Mycobacterium tuberculosis]
MRERELDTGTTTTSSSSIPVSSSSTETTTAGRCLPGSPARAAPRLTSQRSPRRGSAKAVAYRALPLAVLVADCLGGRLGVRGLAFGAEDCLALGLGGQFGEQSRHRDSPFAGLGGQTIPSLG